MDDPGNEVSRKERPVSAIRSELAILALCLREPDAVDEALMLGLTEDDFYDRGRKAIWKGCVDDRQAGTGPDEATILERHEGNLGTHRPFPDFTALSVLVQSLTRLPVRRGQLQTYIESLRSYRSRRSLLALAQDLWILHESGKGTEDLIERAEGAVLGLQEQRTAKGFISWGELARRAKERDDAIRSGMRLDPQLRTGIGVLDDVLKYRRGSYNIIAARPGMGKTQLGLTLAKGFAETGGAVLYVMVEMGDEATEDRIFSSEVGMAEDRETAAIAAVDSTEGLPVLFDFDSKTLSEVCSAVRIAKHRHGIVAFVVDYLQKVRAPRAQNRELAVSAMSDQLCHLAKTTKTCAVVLSQLGRDVERRIDKRPLPSDLRESGSLEQDADSILFVYRHAVYQKAARDPYKVELLLEKQRNGRSSVMIPCYFKPGDGWFRETRDSRWR